MFKLVVLSALIACGTAAPSVHHSPEHYSYAGPVASYAAAAPVVLQEYQHVPAVAKVGEIVEHVPSSVSHHSSAVVHSSAAIATPVITPVAKATIVSAPAPVLHAAPIRTYVEATPIVEEVHEARYVAPIVKQVPVQVQPQAYAKVAEYVEHVPSSVSHHSSSVVHNSAAIATPVITPVAKATFVATPAPVFHAAPVLKEVAHNVVEIRPEIHHAQPAYAKVAEYVEHVPSSVSHHSSSVVHSSAAIATPVITPVAKATIVSAPAPVLHAAPLLKEVAHDVIEVRPEIHHAQPAYAKVAEFVEHVPSSVSHHSSSVVHNSAAIATPVITPVAKTVVATAPVYRQPAPLLKTVHAPAAYAVHESPAVYTNSLPYAAYNHGPAYYNEPLLRSW